MILIASNDAQVHRLSREVLADLGHEQLLANPEVSLETAQEEDICLVDCADAPGALSWSDTGGKGLCLYVVNRDQMDRLPPVLPLSMVGVLVKPVSRSALRLSFEQALDTSLARGGSVRGGAGDRDEILQSLLHAYLRLQEHENERATFLARVLHDFRAPLTAINGYCGLFLEGTLGSLRPKQRDALLRMQRSATRLSRLAFSLFELATRDRLASSAQIAANRMDRVVAQAVAEVRPTADERDISLSIGLEEPAGTLYFDAVQVEQAVINLLENALRFTPRHGSVEIRGYPYLWEGGRADGPNSYRLDVRDFGPAIAGDVLPFVFEECCFDRKASERSSSGLGLATTRLIARDHSGAVWAKSDVEGTVFSFVIPSGAEAAAGATLSGEETLTRGPMWKSL